MKREVVKQLLDLHQREANKYRVQYGCRGCTNFDSKSGSCIHHNAKVPPEFIDQGCDNWEDDDIPF